MKTQHVHYAQSIFRIAVIHLISDLHLNPDQPALLEHFDQYSNTLDPGDDLYILGDLFEYWLGDDAYGPILAQLRETGLQTND